MNGSLHNPTHLADRYVDALGAALRAPAPDDLAVAEALGAELLAAGGRPLALLALHDETVRACLPDLPDAAEAYARARLFLAAFLAPLERRHADLAEQARALEQLPELLLEGIPAFAYVAPWGGRPGEILYASPQVETILGITAVEWIANPHLWLERMEPEDRDCALTDRLQAQAQHTAYVSEYRLRARNGRSVWLHDEARMVADPAGAPQFWQGVMLEISERKAAEQRAIVAERIRLARELHDSVTQSLLAANMHVRSLAKVVRMDPAAVDAHVREIGALTETALSELRVLLLEMRPEELARTPLPRLLEQLGASMNGRTPTRIGVEAEPIPTPPPDVQVATYRIAQEALNNVIKHSRAQTAHVRLQGDGVRLTLSVTDDGAGFDPALVPGGHLGLLGMRERAAAIGARLQVQSRPGGGTTVRLTWPDPRAATRKRTP
jgi:PAS domain S-box-containing protein